MTRGRPPLAAQENAKPIADKRGIVMHYRHEPGSLCDFSINESGSRRICQREAHAPALLCNRRARTPVRTRNRCTPDDRIGWGSGRGFCVGGPDGGTPVFRYVGYYASSDSSARTRIETHNR
jgi:hypothetical protein